MTPFFRTLPPAGNKIPLSLLLHSLKHTGNDRLNGTGLFTQYLDGAHLLYLSSGRAALWLILRGLQSMHPTRKKVILPAYTCPAVVSAVLKSGLQPVLCDINLDDFGYSQNDLEDLIDENVLAVIVVHLFGIQANINPVAELCKKHGILVIEDAAQAFGNEDRSTGTKLGLIGDAGFFSFGRGKPISMLYGGLVATKSNAIYNRCVEIYHDSVPHSSITENLIYLTRLGCYSIFSNPSFYWAPQRLPFLHLGETIFEPDFTISKGSNISSGIARILLQDLDNDKKNRMARAQWYIENVPDTVVSTRALSVAYPFLRYPLLTKDRTTRDVLLKKLNSIGISGALFYPCPLNELPGLLGVLHDNNVYHNAKKLSETLLTLPVHDRVTKHDVSRIKRVIESTAL